MWQLQPRPLWLAIRKALEGSSQVTRIWGSHSINVTDPGDHRAGNTDSRQRNANTHPHKTHTQAQQLTHKGHSMGTTQCVTCWWAHKWGPSPTETSPSLGDTVVHEEARQT